MKKFLKILLIIVGIVFLIFAALICIGLFVDYDDHIENGRYTYVPEDDNKDNAYLLTTLYRICQRAILALRQQSICRFPFLSLWENITASASSLTVRRFQMEHAG